MENETPQDRPLRLFIALATDHHTGEVCGWDLAGVRSFEPLTQEMANGLTGRVFQANEAHVITRHLTNTQHVSAAKEVSKLLNIPLVLGTVRKEQVTVYRICTDPELAKHLPADKVTTIGFGQTGHFVQIRNMGNFQYESLDGEPVRSGHVVTDPDGAQWSLRYFLGSDSWRADLIETGESEHWESVTLNQECIQIQRVGEQYRLHGREIESGDEIVMHKNQLWTLERIAGAKPGTFRWTAKLWRNGRGDWLFLPFGNSRRHLKLEKRDDGNHYGEDGRLFAPGRKFLVKGDEYVAKKNHNTGQWWTALAASVTDD